MVNTGLNLGNDANIKQVHHTEDRRGLGKRTGKLLSHLHPDFPHILCLTEHHLKYSRLEKVHIEGYKLGAHFCRQIQEKGDIAIFVRNSLGFLNIDIVKHCKEQGIGICALKLTFGTLNICVLTFFRVPSGNVSTF